MRCEASPNIHLRERNPHLDVEGLTYCHILPCGTRLNAGAKLSSAGRVAKWCVWDQEKATALGV